MQGTAALWATHAPSVRGMSNTTGPPSPPGGADRLHDNRRCQNVLKALGTFSKLECTVASSSRPCRRKASSDRHAAAPRYLGEDERQDAFATFIQILSRRLQAERAGGCRRLASNMVEYCI